MGFNHAKAVLMMREIEALNRRNQEISRLLDFIMSAKNEYSEKTHAEPENDAFVTVDINGPEDMYFAVGSFFISLDILEEAARIQLSRNLRSVDKLNDQIDEFRKNGL